MAAKDKSGTVQLKDVNSVEATRPKGNSVDRLVSTATVMFNQLGIHGAGIDRVLKEADVARMTLYNHFGSKEGLIKEVLRRESVAWFERLDEAMSASPAGARKRLDAYFNVLRDWFSEPSFKGCGFINAVGESAQDDNCVRPIAKAHREANVEFIKAILGNEIAFVEEFADVLVTLSDGAIVDTMVMGDPDILERARRAALRLFDISAAREAAA